MGELLRTLALEHHLEVAMLGMPRLALFLSITPFLGASLLSGQIRLPIILALYFFVHPVLLGQLPEGTELLIRKNVLEIGGLMLKEAFLGFLLAYLSSLAFWAVQSAGFLMDNQRGASQANVSDPLSGEESSPLGSFLFQSFVFIFFASGAFLTFLLLIFQTYVFWPPGAWLPNLAGAQLPLFVAGAVSWLMTKMLLLAGIVLVASLLVDLALGLINRFASQLNVYILAMPIKSGLAMLIVLASFGAFVDSGPELFEEMTNTLLSLRRFLS
ncbi:MAG: type III secretion system export apparatus subunit SctT [Candidatus Accumulibacter sp.]|jgi:type III secretion protein T|nr:type III secretion system export apparatus subunit SctT [Accumulibacter sp.]